MRDRVLWHWRHSRSGARAAKQQDAAPSPGSALLHDGAAIAPDVEAAGRLDALVRVEIRANSDRARAISLHNKESP